MPKRKLSDMTEEEMREVVLRRYNMHNTISTVKLEGDRINFTGTGFIPTGVVHLRSLNPYEANYLRDRGFWLYQDMTIAERLRDHLDNDRQLSGPGGMFRGSDFTAIVSVLTGEADNFIVFNNGGGRPFFVWIFADMQRRNPDNTLEGFKKFAEDVRGYTYMRKIDGREEIFSDLPTY